MSATCPDFVSHPHVLESGHYCYTCQVSASSEEQGTARIAEALISAGVERVVEEQTGGFCMVVYIYSEDHKRALSVVPWGVGFHSDLEEEQNESNFVDLTSEGLPEEGAGLTDEALGVLVGVVKENLYRLA